MPHVRSLTGVLVLALIWSCADSPRSAEDAASSGAGGGAGEGNLSAGSLGMSGGSHAGGEDASGGDFGEAGRSAPTAAGAAGAANTEGGAAGSDHGGAGGAGGEGGEGKILTPEQEKCVASYSVEGSPNPDVGGVLAACPALADFLFWVDAQNDDVAYASWPVEMQDRLAALYQTMLAGDPLDDLDCPDPRGDDSARTVLAAGIPGNTPIAIYFTTAQASDMYLASVAHALALEVSQALPYSLLDYPGAELEPLFSARSIVVPVTQPPKPFGAPLPDATYQVPMNHDGLGFVCDPRTGYDFARGISSYSHEDMVGSSATRTLANLTLFLTLNSVHGFPIGYNESVDTYQFELAERLHRGLDQPAGTPSQTLVSRLGCHHTAELLEELARAMNVPVRGVGAYSGAWTDGTNYPFRYNSHRALAYAWTRPEARILPHSDFVNATGLHPNYGGPSTPLAFFELIWRSAESYEAMGFDIDMSMPIVPILPTNSNGAFETRYDFGRVVAVTNGEPRFYLRTEACAWDLAYAYCVDPAGGPRALADNHPYNGYPEFSDPDLLQGCYDTIAACVTSLPGGCNDVPDSYPSLVAANYLP
jgi:hypothetical protein